MKTNTPQTYMGITADAPCMEKPSDCKPPKDGDVRLDIYGHGSLYMYYEHAWRHVVGQLSNATALAQCRRLGQSADCARLPPRCCGQRCAAWHSGSWALPLAVRAPPTTDAACNRAGFTEGGVREEDASLPVTLGAEPVVLVDEPCLPGEPLLHCARRSRPAADVGAQLRATRLSCRSVGPGACFVNREGHPRCMQGTVRYDKETAPLHMPSMACGTAGTKFLDRPPVVPPSPQTKEQTGCLTLFDDALGRCVTPPAVGGSGGHGRGHSAGHGGGQGSGDRRMCSQACHDSVIQAIRRDDCFEVEVNSSWGVNYGDALKDHAETVYSHCGTDLWQSAALSADTYEKCVDLLLDMFRRCQEDSERHLCSDSCAEKVDEAMAAESCYSVHYYRNEPRAFRGHVTLLNELRERVCIWLPPDWDLTPGTTAAYFYRR